MSVINWYGAKSNALFDDMIKLIESAALTVEQYISYTRFLIRLVQASGPYASEKIEKIQDYIGGYAVEKTIWHPVIDMSGCIVLYEEGL